MVRFKKYDGNMLFTTKTEGINKNKLFYLRALIADLKKESEKAMGRKKKD